MNGKTIGLLALLALVALAFKSKGAAAKTTSNIPTWQGGSVPTGTINPLAQHPNYSDPGQSKITQPINQYPGEYYAY